MRLLILGGTVFLGRHLVDAARARGHAVTLFNRGRAGPGLFADVERLTGDRDSDLAPLRGRTWDAVVDTCGYVPRIVRKSAERLRDAVGHYTFVSSISVYAEGAATGSDESAPVRMLEDPRVESITGETYGPLKALCERAVQDALGDRAFVVRPGLIVGPFDPSGRFTYWVTRIAKGGEVLAPGDPQMQVQFIDARDGAEWIVRCAEERVTGVQNMTGPEQPLTMRGFLDAARGVLNVDARYEWVAEDFLLECGVAPWTEIPLWIPATDRGVLAVSIDRALASGLRFRPLATTLGDTLTWAQSADANRAPPERVTAGPRPQIGLAPERERALLDEWRARSPHP